MFKTKNRKEIEQLELEMKQLMCKHGGAREHRHPKLNYTLHLNKYIQWKESFCTKCGKHVGNISYVDLLREQVINLKHNLKAIEVSIDVEENNKNRYGNDAPEVGTYPDGYVPLPKKMEDYFAAIPKED